MNDENIDYDFDYSPLLLSEIDNPDYIEFITSLNDPTKYEDDGQFFISSLFIFHIFFPISFFNIGIY